MHRMIRLPGDDIQELRDAPVQVRFVLFANECVAIQAKEDLHWKHDYTGRKYHER